MKNELVVAQAIHNEVRVKCVITTDIVEEFRKRHNSYPTSTSAMGRTMSMGLIMASELKDEDQKVTITINGGGPIGNLVVIANGKLEVKGMMDYPDIYIFNQERQKLDVGKAIGTSGHLIVTKDLGLKEPFNGVVPIQTGEIGYDFAYYFSASEQVNSLINVGVLVDADFHVKSAGGLMIQLLPNASEETIVKLEQLATKMKHMSSYIEEGKDAQAIIETLFDDAQILEHRPVRFACHCSKEGFYRSLKLIQRHEIEQMLHEDHGAEIVCEYCKTKYQFTEEDLKRILEEKDVENR